MGAWDYQPWDNDEAADWFAELMESTGLPEHVEAALRSDTEEYPERIRAAAFVLRCLGRVYVWPIENLDAHLKLAVDRLKAIRELSESEESADLLVEAINAEIAELESRLPTPGGE